MLISFNNNHTDNNLDTYHQFPSNITSSSIHTFSSLTDHNQFGLASNVNQIQSNLESLSNFAVPQHSTIMSEADRKRAHHNALERKRRDHIKDSFHTLRDAIPNIKGEKVSVSRNKDFFKFEKLNC